MDYNLQVFPTPEALARTAAEQIVRLANNTISTHGRFSVGLSGGSTPQRLFALLASSEFAPHIDWVNVYLFWGDERTVPPDHNDSNYRMARETLLAHVPIPPDNVRRMKGELDPAQAADEYEHVLRMFFPDRPWPCFDLLLLGMGDDGHTASLFPGTSALQEKTRWVVANHVPKLNTWRITLTAPAINAASNIMFLVAGTGKCETLRAVLQESHQPEILPSQMIQPAEGTLTWMVDAAAAAYL